MHATNPDVSAALRAAAMQQQTYQTLRLHLGASILAGLAGPLLEAISVYPTVDEDKAKKLARLAIQLADALLCEANSSARK